MKQKLQMGPVGMDPGPIIRFITDNSAKLKTETLPLPGRHGKLGMKVVRTTNLDGVDGAKAIVTGHEVGGVRYSVFYS